MSEPWAAFALDRCQALAAWGCGRRLAICGLIKLVARQQGERMPEEPKGGNKWTAAERAALRKLLRMAIIMLLAIVVAGTLAALFSSALGTL